MTDIVKKQFIFWNCCGGVSGKVDSVSWLLKTYEPEVLFVMEAEFELTQTWIKFESYSMEITETGDLGKIRLISLIHESSKLKRSAIKIDKDLEMIALENIHEIVIGVYRPFKNINNNTQQTYFDKLLINLKSISMKTTKKICIGGDFNINYLKEGYMKERLEEWSIEYDYNQLIDKPTWQRIVKVQDKKVLRHSLLDLIFTNSDGMAEIMDKLDSDHCCISFTFKNNDFKINRKKWKRRDYRKYNAQSISTAFSENMMNQSLSGDPNFDIETITESITDGLDKLCPFRTVRTARPTDVINLPLEKLKKKRKRLLKEYNKSGDEHILYLINNLNIRIKNGIKEARKHQI